MADPFETRMRFTSLLANLTATTNSSVKTAHYALKHSDQAEDLHSCIIENLEQSVQSQPHLQSSSSRNNHGHGNNSSTTTTGTTSSAVNSRANVMYFLEHFCDLALKEGQGHHAYVDFVRRDIEKIVACVASGGTNVKVVRKVVGELGNKGVLDHEVIARIEVELKLKEKERGALLEGSSTGGDGSNSAAAAVTANDGDDAMMNDAEGGEQSRRSAPDTSRSVPRTGGKDGKTNGVSKADRKAIEQRIEEDRERNKRLREGVWAVQGDDEQELDKLWDEVSDVSEEDYVLAREEADERRQFARYHQSLLGR